MLAAASSRVSTAAGPPPLPSLLAALALATLAAAPRRASAQPRPDNGAPPRTTPASREERDREARTEFNAGREAFARGNYEEAARRFEHAYHLSQRAQLYYNIGTTYDRLHRWVEARDAFQRYLQAFPQAMERDEVRARLTVIETEIRRERELAESAGRPIIVVRPGRDRVIVRPAPVEPPHPWRFVAIGAGSLALVSGAAAGIIAVVSAGFYDGLVRDCGDLSGAWMNDPAHTGCPASTIADLELRAGIINVLIGGAAGLAAVAAVSLVIDAATTRRPAPAASAPPNDPGAPRARRTAPPGTSRVRASFAPLFAPATVRDAGAAPSLAAGALSGGMFVVSGAL